MAVKSSSANKNMAAMREEEDLSSSSTEAYVLPWDHFRRWITCFCVVTFDIEVGQAMEVIYGAYDVKMKCYFRYHVGGVSMPMKVKPGIFTSFKNLIFVVYS